MAGHQRLRGAGGARSLTAQTDWEAVQTVGRELHAVMKRYQRDRWWFLGENNPPRANRADVMWHRDLASVRGPTISATIRADCYDSGKPPRISVDFVRPRIAVDLVLPRPAPKKLTLRIGLKGEGKPYGWLKLPSLKNTHDTTRKRFLKGLRQSRVHNPSKGERLERLWWVEPGKTPDETTIFVFLLYLKQVKMRDLQFDSQQFLERFMRRYGGNDIPSGDSGMVFSIFGQMTTHFTVPQDWRSLTAYLKRVIRTELAGERSQWLQEWLQERAGALDVSERTVIRWLKNQDGNGQMSFSLQSAVLDKLTEKAETRTLRRLAFKALCQSGKKKEAARKYLQRHLAAGETAAGETYVSIIRKFGSPRMLAAPV